MGKRIFTKCFAGGVEVTAAEPTISLNIAPWLMQEEVSIIGVDMDLALETPSENDGFTSMTMEFSQIGAWGADGSIASVSAYEGWNTTPAGICGVNGHTSFFLPDGKSIDIKEEGALYLNSTSYGKTAGSTHYRYVLTIFYEKKTGR
ncbi:hypothetical protein ES705_33254 [subsurface metagenome]